MLVLHAGWLTGASSRLAVWAEDSVPTPRPGRRGRPPRVRPHPSAVPADQLAGLLPEAGSSAAAGPVTLTLPTRHGRPVSSPELVLDDLDDAAGPVTAVSWQLAALLLDADQAYAVLRSVATDAAVWGASMLHLAQVAAFAADLVSRGRLLPVLLAEPEPRAVWRPVLTGGDAAWARALVAAMPPPVAATDPARRVSVWADALDSLVDATARAVLGAARLAPGRAGLPAARAGRWP